MGRREATDLNRIPMGPIDVIAGLQNFKLYKAGFFSVRWGVLEVIFYESGGEKHIRLQQNKAALNTFK